MAGYETLFVYAGKAQDKCLCVSLLLHSVGHDRKWDLGEGKEARVKHNALFLSLIDKSPFQPLDISDTRMSISRARTAWHTLFQREPYVLYFGASQGRKRSLNSILCMFVA